MKGKDNDKEKVDRFGLMMAQLGVTLRSAWRMLGAVMDKTIVKWCVCIARAIQHGWRWWWNNTFLCVTSYFMIVFGIFAGVCVLGAKCNESEVKRKAELYERIEADWTVNDTSFVKKMDGMYIYRREIEGHPYYLYRKADEEHHIQSEALVPVTGCEQ